MGRDPVGCFMFFFLHKNRVTQCPLSHAKYNVVVVANKTEYIIW